MLPYLLPFKCLHNLSCRPAPNPIFFFVVFPSGLYLFSPPNTRDKQYAPFFSHTSLLPVVSCSTPPQP